MFILSMKMSKKKMLAVLLAVVVVVAGIIIAVSGIFGGAKKTSTGVDLSVKSEKDVAAYVKSYGWEIDKEPEEIVDVLVPAEFNDVYVNYNAIQKTQGFDLESFKGKEAQRYTYIVRNYPDYPENIRADVIVCDKQIIASDICSLELNGFMHGIGENTAK